MYHILTWQPCKHSLDHILNTIHPISKFLFAKSIFFHAESNSDSQMSISVTNFAGLPDSAFPPGNPWKTCRIISLFCKINYFFMLYQNQTSKLRYMLRIFPPGNPWKTCQTISMSPSKGCQAESGNPAKSLTDISILLSSSDSAWKIVDFAKKEFRNRMSGDWDIIQQVFQGLPGGNAESGNPEKSLTDTSISLFGSDSAWKNRLFCKKIGN